MELSSQLESQLDELERLQSIKSRDEDQARKLEQESAMHEELSAICDEQASEIVRLQALLAEDQARITEEESAVHQELSAICDKQASEIVRLRALLAGKEEETKVLKDRIERIKQDMKRQGNWRQKGMEEEFAKWLSLL